MSLTHLFHIKLKKKKNSDTENMYLGKLLKKLVQNH